MKSYLIDVAEIQTFLQTHYDAIIEEVKELGQGEWSVAFAFIGGRGIQHGKLLIF